MISAREFAGSLYGLWLFLKLDPGALACFTRTPGGFWRAYVAALILAPLNFLHVAMAYDAAKATAGPLSYAAVEVISYVMSWTVYPFAMIYIARLLGREGRLLNYLVPYVWFQLAVGLAFFPITLLYDFGLLAAEGAAFLQLMMIGLYVSYAAFLARSALDIAMSSAVGLALFDVVLGLLVNQIINRV